MLAETPSLVSTVLQGVYQSHQATAAAIQVNNINLIRGLIGKPDSGLLQMNGQPTAQNTRECGADGDLPAFRNWDNLDHVRELAALWNVDVDQIPHWSPPTHALEIFRFAEQGSIHMLWISGTNPAVSLPDLGRVRSILSNPDLFVVVNEIFPTETSELADVVLPAAMWGEKTGTFTNVDRTVHIAHKAVNPPGEARSDLDILLDYARRMDFRDRDGAPLIKWHDPESTFEAWKRCTRGRPCDYTGLTYQTLTGGSGICWPCNEQHPHGKKRLYEDFRFNTSADYCETYGHDLRTGGVVHATEYRASDPCGRAQLKAAEYMAPHECPDHQYPFWLSTGRLVYHFHTRTKTGRARELARAAPDVYVEIHAEDARTLGVQDGEWLRLTSRRGKLEARARIGSVERGRLFVPFHYGYWDDPERMRAANELTLFEWDPVSKQPYFKYAAVGLERIEKPSTLQPIKGPASASDLVDRARHAVTTLVKTIKPERSKIGEYIGLLHGSEEALARTLEQVADAHEREPDVRGECRQLASTARDALPEIAKLKSRYGEAREAEPERLGKAVSPQLKATGYGLVRDLHDCWLLACESQMSLVLLDQAGKALRDEQMIELLRHMSEENARVRNWLMTRAMRAAPQALVVPS